MAKKIYDVIIVGTGAGGGMAIKMLCEAGLNVLACSPSARRNTLHFIEEACYDSRVLLKR